jgi:hypothetical protein
VLPPSLTTIVDRLIAHQVRFILVGGMAIVAQGVPVTTIDIDIVHDRDHENVDRLLGFLAEVRATYRRPGAPLAPQRSALLGPGHNLFRTDLGPIDVLGAIEGGRDYAALALESLVIPFGARTIQVLRLASIVEWKRRSAHTKDKAVLPLLEAALKRLAAATGSEPS